MFFIKAYRDVPPPAPNEPRISQAEYSARDNQHGLVINRIKAFISLDERGVASLSNLNHDSIYGPILRHVQDCVTQKNKSNLNAIKLPAWLRCDACKFFFLQPFCLPCCNSILCKHCIHSLRQQLYESPDSLGPTDRRVPNPTIPCPLCKKPLHGTQVDAWNNSEKRLVLQITIRYNMPGAHELTMVPEENVVVLAENQSDKEEGLLMPASITGEAGSKEFEFRILPPEEDSRLKTLPLRPNKSLAMEQKMSQPSNSLLTLSHNKGSVAKLISQSRPTEICWKTLPVVLYSASLHGKLTPEHLHMAVTLRHGPVMLSPVTKSAKVGTGLQDLSPKRLCTNFSPDISPLYLGVTPDTALGPCKTTVNHQDDPLAESDSPFLSDVLSDSHPFSIRNQFRMSTEFEPLWRSYYQDHAEVHLPDPGSAGDEDTELGGEEAWSRCKNGDSTSLSHRDFHFENSMPNDEHEDEHVNFNATCCEGEPADRSMEAKHNATSISSHLTANAHTLASPRKLPGSLYITPQKRTTKLTYGLLTPPDSAASVKDESQEYPSPAPSQRFFPSTPSSPTSPLSSKKRRNNFRPKRRQAAPSIAPPLATPTRKDHALYTGHETQEKEETEHPFNLEEQLNDREIYNRTLDIQKHRRHSLNSENITSPSPSLSSQKDTPTPSERDWLDESQVPGISQRSKTSSPLFRMEEEDPEITDSKDESELSRRTVESLSQAAHMLQHFSTTEKRKATDRRRRPSWKI